jgi:hypothetical protein
VANNTNAQAIAFSNNKFRPLADGMETLYQNCKNVVQQWTAQGLAAVIPNDANFIQDGATVASGTPDGRTPITDADVNVLFAHAQNLIAYFEGATGAPVNNGSMQNRNQIVKVSVNGRATL